MHVALRLVLFALLLACRLNALPFLLGADAIPYTHSEPRAREVVLVAAGTCVALSSESEWATATGARSPSLIHAYRDLKQITGAKQFTGAAVHMVFAEVDLPEGNSGVVVCTSLDSGATWDVPLLVSRGARSPVACVHEAQGIIIILAHYDSGIHSITWSAADVNALVDFRTIPSAVPSPLPRFAFAGSTDVRLGCGATYSPVSHSVLVPVVMSGEQVALFAYNKAGKWRVETVPGARGSQPTVSCWRPAGSGLILMKTELLLTWRSADTSVPGVHYRNTATRIDGGTWDVAACARMGAWQAAACNAGLISTENRTKLLLVGPSKRFWKGLALSQWDERDRTFHELAIMTRGNTASPHVLLDEERKRILGAVAEDSGGDLREEALVGLHFVPRRVVFVAAPASLPHFI